MKSNISLSPNIAQNCNRQPKLSSGLKKIFGLILLLIPYLLYVGFVIKTNQGPVDYETFMDIGQRFIEGTQVYGENSYYPMPFVLIFAFFSWLPRPISITIWLLAPVIFAIIIFKGNPLILLFAPLFSHFVGGQTSLFGMLGFWGYRKFIDPNKAFGGILLSLTLLKPQLGLVPLIYAIIQWYLELKKHKRICVQAWACIISTILIYLPCFIIFPNWVAHWLNNPRPLFERAMSGFIPRTLLYIFHSETVIYWLSLSILSIFLFIGLWFLYGKSLTLYLAVIGSFIVNPLVHDYDIIELIPLLDTPLRIWLAVLSSIPGWLVIIFAYSNDHAWYVYSIIAPFILFAILYPTLFKNEKAPIITEHKMNK